MRFKDKHIVILGGTSGIGLAVARGALAEGASVTAASHRQDSVDKARAGFQSPSGANVTIENVDVTNEAVLKAFFERVGSFDHLVFTAGDDVPLGPLVSKDLTEARTRFEVRYWGALAAAKYGMGSIRTGGSMVLTSGFSSKRPRPGWTSQASIQSAIEGLTRALAVELAPIRVNAVSPGPARTPRWDAWPESARREFYQTEEKRLPVGHVGEAAEIATAYLYLIETGGAAYAEVLIVLRGCAPEDCRVSVGLDRHASEAVVRSMLTDKVRSHLRDHGMSSRSVF